LQDERRLVEHRLLQKKGVVSVYFAGCGERCVVRVRANIRNEVRALSLSRILFHPDSGHRTGIRGSRRCPLRSSAGCEFASESENCLPSSFPHRAISHIFYLRSASVSR
jgi:hypothetical protein